jgi:hypothetical protein
MNRQVTRRRRNLEWLTEYRSSLICSGCGIEFATAPELCEFHHRDPSKKIDCVSNLTKNSRSALLYEISKCDPLCFICHSIAHTRY